MELAIKATAEALLDSSRVEWSSLRPDPGAEPHAQEIFLGVGSRSDKDPPHPRMLGWKLPQWRQKGVLSSTGAALQSADMLDRLDATTTLTLRVHAPTLDTVVASFLITHRVLHRAWPSAVGPLVEFVSDWEQGRIEDAGHYQRSLASVFYASMQIWKTSDGSIPRQAVELLAGVVGRNLSRAQLGELPLDLIPPRVTRRLKADTDLYRAELTRAQRVQLDLPVDTTPDSPSRRIDAMFVSSLQDVTVLKLLARPDTEHSSYGQGFDLLAIHAPNEKQPYARHTISLAPERSGTLANLAELLDVTEGDLAPDGTTRARGKPRFPNQPNDFADPWYCDGYAAKGRSTIVAPPYAGTRLSRENIWEAIWDRFNVGRNIKVTSSLSVFVRPYRLTGELEKEELLERGWMRSALNAQAATLLPSVAESFLDDKRGADIEHFERPAGERTIHLALYPNDVVLIWIEQSSSEPTTLFELARYQAELVHGPTLGALSAVAEIASKAEPLIPSRWLVFGAYQVDRARSSMIDDSRSVTGLFHCLSAGTRPTLSQLPSLAAGESRKVFRDTAGDTEHWFTSTGGARLEFILEPADAGRLRLDQDFHLFLLTTGQRYAVFEITRRMGEVERAARKSPLQRLRPDSDVRADVMLFTNSLWFSRVSDDPDINSRYLAWHRLHGMDETVDAMRDQTAELDQYRKERLEGMVAVLVFVFLPITLACGFFGGVQFDEIELTKGIPWSTGGWVLFLVYTAVFTVLVFGTVLVARLLSSRSR